MRPAAFALLVLASVLCLGGCVRHQAASGSTRYERIEYGPTGQPTSRTIVDFAQNENPETGSTLIIRGADLEVSHGTSWIQKLPKSFAGMETILTVSGVILLVLAGGFAYFQHWKLMTLSLLGGGGLISLAVTIEQYAWAYGLGLVATLALAGWFLWRRYLRHLSTQNETPGFFPAAPSPRAGEGRGAPSIGAGPLKDA